MYRLIIADDEDMIRKSLSSMIDWSALGFQIVGNFADGQEVIDYLEYMEADVIMTDIKMTCASGLDIARYVHENHCPCKMIFISAHQEFDLALQGIRYGVKDYLLKPAGIETIRKTFVHMKELLDAEAGSRSREASVARLADLLPELRSQLFSDVVLGVLQNADYIANRLEVLYPNSRLEQAPCVVVDAWIQDYPHFMKNVWDGSKDDFQDRMRTYFAQNSAQIVANIAYQSDNFLKLCLLIPNEGATGEGAIHSFFDAFSQAFHVRLEHCTVGQYKNLAEAASGCQELVFSSQHITDATTRHLHEQKKLIVSNVSNGNIPAAQRLLHLVLEELRGCDIAYCTNTTIEIFSQINEAIKAGYVLLSEGVGQCINYSAIASQKGIAQLEACCERILDKIKQLVGEHGASDQDNLTFKAQQYIQDHISQDISQEDVANYLFISSSYLSRIFKQRTGKSFSSFVVRTKMDRAIQLLREPKYKAYQVGEALGYNTPRYFSRLFREHAGMTPSEYRSRVLNMGGALKHEDE